MVEIRTSQNQPTVQNHLPLLKESTELCTACTELLSGVNLPQSSMACGTKNFLWGGEGACGNGKEGCVGSPL